MEETIKSMEMKFETIVRVSTENQLLIEHLLEMRKTKSKRGPKRPRAYDYHDDIAKRSIERVAEQIEIVDALLAENEVERLSDAEKCYATWSCVPEAYTWEIEGCDPVLKPQYFTSVILEDCCPKVKCGRLGDGYEVIAQRVDDVSHAARAESRIARLPQGVVCDPCDYEHLCRDILCDDWSVRDPLAYCVCEIDGDDVTVHHRVETHAEARARAGTNGIVLGLRPGERKIDAEVFAAFGLAFQRDPINHEESDRIKLNSNSIPVHQVAARIAKR